MSMFGGQTCIGLAFPVNRLVHKRSDYTTLHMESARTVCFCTERTQKRVKAHQFHMFLQFYKSALYRRTPYDECTRKGIMH